MLILFFKMKTKKNRLLSFAISSFQILKRTLRRQVIPFGNDLEFIKEIKSNNLFDDHLNKIKEKHKGKKMIVCALNTIVSGSSENILVAFNNLVADENVVLLQLEKHVCYFETEKKN